MKDEVWKAIPGFDGYEASSHGRIKRANVVSKRTGLAMPEKILCPTPTGDGHLQVGVYGDKKHTVHSLVLFAFVGPRPFANAQTRHLDDNPRNNNICNLVWGTAKENAADREINNPWFRDRERAARIAAKLCALGEASYKDMAEVASEFSVAPKTVRRIMDKLKSGKFPISTVSMEV